MVVNGFFTRDKSTKIVGFGGPFLYRDHVRIGMKTFYLSRGVSEWKLGPLTENDPHVRKWKVWLWKTRVNNLPSQNGPFWVDDVPFWVDDMDEPFPGTGNMDIRKFAIRMKWTIHSFWANPFVKSFQNKIGPENKLSQKDISSFNPPFFRCYVSVVIPPALRRDRRFHFILHFLFIHFM